MNPSRLKAVQLTSASKALDPLILVVSQEAAISSSCRNFIPFYSFFPEVIGGCCNYEDSRTQVRNVWESQRKCMRKHAGAVHGGQNAAETLPGLSRRTLRSWRVPGKITLSPAACLVAIQRDRLQAQRASLWKTRKKRRNEHGRYYKE